VGAADFVASVEDPPGKFSFVAARHPDPNVFSKHHPKELTTNTNGGRLRVMGTSTSTATSVAVNGTNALRYNDATFAATKSGLFADANLYRFSSKEAHLNSGLVYYLCRYYDPNLQ
jgi:hypothetical protein